MPDINTGFIRKIHHSSQTAELFSYPEFIFNRSLRIKLYNELEDGGISLFCGCSTCNDRPLGITQQMALSFPSGILHSTVCVSYLKTLMQCISSPIMAALESRSVLPTTFSWVKGSRSNCGVITKPEINGVYSSDMTCSFSTFIAFINQKTWFHIAMKIKHQLLMHYPSHEDFIQQVQFEFGKITLKDKHGNLFPLTSSNMFSQKAAPGHTSFLYARLISVDSSYNSQVYIRVQHSYGSSSIQVPHDKWDSLLPQIMTDFPIYICGFVRTQEVTSFTRKKDSITHSYSSSTGIKRKIHTMHSFYLFHSNSYGMMCFSPNELLESNQYCSQSQCCYRPFFPALPGEGNFHRR